MGAVGHRLPEDAVPLPEWPARPATWPTKSQLDDEATHYIDLVPVKDVEWAIQHSGSNGGFQCFESENLVKYKVWPNNTQKSLHPSQKTWRKTALALVKSSEHDRFVAGKAERLAKQMASMTPPSSAAAAAAKPKLKKRKGPDDDSSTESAEAADSYVEDVEGFLDGSAPREWKIIENRVLCSERMDLPRDGPDRPACIVMWYSAPLAEELCHGYKGAKHALHLKNLATCVEASHISSGKNYALFQNFPPRTFSFKTKGFCEKHEMIFVPHLSSLSVSLMM